MAGKGNAPKSYETLKREIEDDTNGEYSLLTTKEEWDNDLKFRPRSKEKKISVRHNCHLCDYNTYTVQPHLFINRGQRCQLCNNNKRLTEDEYNRRIKSREPEYKVLTPYSTKTSEISVLHIPCGHQYITTLYKFYTERCQCFECYGSKKMTDEEFQKYMNVYGNNEYRLLSSYITTNEYVTVQHKPCGHVYNVRPYKFKQGRRCPYCAGVKIKTLDEFKQQVLELTDGKYECIDTQYINNKTPIKIKHHECGHEYLVKPNYFINGTRCPECAKNRRKSAAVKQIIEILDENTYELEYVYDDCKNERYLPFDFFLSNQSILIEYDGKQHFIPWSSKEDCDHKYTLEYRHYNDNIKTKYCIDNNLTLIRIPYTLENDLDDIVQSILDGSYLEDTRLFILQNGKLHNQPELYDYLLNEMDN